MSIEGIMIKWVIERLISIIPSINSMAKDNRELTDKALHSISKALDKTCLYVDRYIKSSKCDKEIEEQLVTYWSEAAISLRYIDKELADICLYKREYWLNPLEWDASKTNGIAIDLAEVQKKYKQMLMTK